MSGGASSGQQSWPSTSRSRSPSAIQPQSQNQSAQSSLSSNFGRNPTTPPPPLGLGLGLQNRHRSMYRWSSASVPVPIHSPRSPSPPRPPPHQSSSFSSSTRPRGLFAESHVTSAVRVVPAGLNWRPTAFPVVVPNIMVHSDEEMDSQEKDPTFIFRLPPIPPQQPSTSAQACRMDISFQAAAASPSCSSLALEAFQFSDSQLSLAILAQLSDFRQDQAMCDVTLIVEDQQIYAHRCVLAAAVPYFRAMFTSMMLETNMAEITINDISYAAMSLLIDFVYTHTICIDSDNVQALLFAASILQMDSVCIACQKFLSRFLTTSNCLSIRQFAERHNCTDLLGNTDDFAVEHFTELSSLEEFKQIPFTHMRDLIRRSDLHIRSEEQVFETVVAWVAFDESSRIEHFADLLSLVRLPQLALHYLCDVVKKHPFVRSNRRCVDQVSDALFEMVSPFKTAGFQNQPAAALLMEELGTGQYAAVTGAGNMPPISRPLSPNSISIKSRPRKSMAGVVFCAGGRGTAGDPFRSVEAFDWRRNRWLPVAEMTQQRRHVGVVSAMGKLYAIGGHDGCEHLCSAEVFEPSDGRWRRVASMNTSRRGIAVATLDGAIYAVGGLDDQTCFDTVERYDIEMDTWSEVAKMRVQRGGVGVTALGKHLFAIGGNNGTSSLDSCERYDPLVNRWHHIQHMSNRRAGAGVCVLDGFLYAVGGFDDNAPLSTCERYNVENDCWQPVANMSCPRGGVGVAAMGGLVYAIGGHDGTRYLNTVEALDPTTNQWMPVADIKECRAGAGVAWADCRMDDLLRKQDSSGCAPSFGQQCI